MMLQSKAVKPSPKTYERGRDTHIYNSKARYGLLKVATVATINNLCQLGAVTEVRQANIYT
jgi:hypothetical protein